MKRFLLVLPLLGALFISGCWSKREINELAIVSSVAIDRSKDGWEIIAEIFLPSSSQGLGGGGISPARQSWLAVGKGPTIFTAIRDLTLKVPRRIYWAHCTAIIVGEEVARSGLIQVLDFWDRDAEARRSTYLYICRGKATDLLINSFGSMERTAGLQLAGLAKTSRISGYAKVVTIHQFMVDLALPGVDPSTAGLVLSPLSEVPGFVPTGKADVKTGVNVMELYLGSQAVFKGTKLVGWLDKKETRGLLWVRDNIKDLIVIEVPGSRGQKIDLEIFNTSSKFSVTEKNGKAHLLVKIKLIMGLADQSSSKELVGKISPVLERKAQAVVKKELEAAWKKVSKIGVDPFGFGHIVNTKNPQLWKKVRTSWPEDISVSWQVEAIIESNGLSIRGPKERRES